MDTLQRDIIQTYQQEADQITYGDYFLEGFQLDKSFVPIEQQGGNANLSERRFLNNAPEYIRVALSGGPSSGKSTLIKTLHNNFENIFVYKEVSSLLIQHILQRLERLGSDKKSSRASHVFGNTEHATVYEHLVLLIKQLQKKYADSIAQGVHISDRAGIEGYHFMTLSQVEITPSIVQKLHEIKESLVFFCDRRSMIQQNGIRYENNDDAQKQHLSLEKTLLEQGYSYGNNLHKIPTFLPTHELVSHRDYHNANQKRVQEIVRILTGL